MGDKHVAIGRGSRIAGGNDDNSIMALLFTCLDNPSINFRDMAAMDEHGRTYSALEHKFRKWRQMGRKVADKQPEHAGTVGAMPPRKRPIAAATDRPAKTATRGKGKAKPDDDIDEVAKKQDAFELLPEYADQMMKGENGNKAKSKEEQEDVANEEAEPQVTEGATAKKTREAAEKKAKKAQEAAEEAAEKRRVKDNESDEGPIVKKQKGKHHATKGPAKGNKKGKASQVDEAKEEKDVLANKSDDEKTTGEVTDADVPKKLEDASAAKPPRRRRRKAEGSAWRHQYTKDFEKWEIENNESAPFEAFEKEIFDDKEYEDEIKKEIKRKTEEDREIAIEAHDQYMMKYPGDWKGLEAWMRQHPNKPATLEQDIKYKKEDPRTKTKKRRPHEDEDDMDPEAEEIDEDFDEDAYADDVSQGENEKDLELSDDGEDISEYEDMGWGPAAPPSMRDGTKAPPKPKTLPKSKAPPKVKAPLKTKTKAKAPRKSKAKSQTPAPAARPSRKSKTEGVEKAKAQAKAEEDEDADLDGEDEEADGQQLDKQLDQ